MDMENDPEVSGERLSLVLTAYAIFHKWLSRVNTPL